MLGFRKALSKSIQARKGGTINRRGGQPRKGGTVNRPEDFLLRR